MKRIALCILALAMPVAAEAAPRDITPMASYCVEALVNSRILQTTAMVATTAEAVGRGNADERVEFFTVPHEELGFSRMNIGGRYACAVFPLEGSSGWTESSVTAHMQKLGMLEAPNCVDGGNAVWLSSLYNLRRKGVTAIANVQDGEIVEILAYETPGLVRPSDCKKEQAQ